MSAEETSFAGARPAIKPATEALELLMSAHYDRQAKVGDSAMLTFALGWLAAAADDPSQPISAGIVVEAVTAAIATCGLRSGDQS